MSVETVECSTIEEARQYASDNGPALVLSQYELDSLERYQQALDDSGGMTGVSDRAPYSAVGQEGTPVSSASDPPPTEFVDPGEYVSADAIGVALEGALEKVLEFRDLIEAFKGLAGPVIVVPVRELKRAAGIYDPADGA